MYRNRLHKALRERRMSPERLAQLASVPETTISRMIKDPAYMPPASTLAKIARALQVPMRDLLEEIPDR
ncbi:MULTISPECIES: helix-turn-helix domain-containing protein [Thermogemmatispora]|uniref:helix-turn-helix domain-containing protein n=1 Tax=Thermogemmatispora TaxID=768669 RepID=UPI001CB996B6|nr:MULTISPECIES: helix-turn-helix transcriptional regulator [Thermogemmatispora]